MNTMVGKVGVIVSIILFCIAVGVYSFVQLSVADKGKNVDLLSFVPADCMAVLETDNADFLVNEFPHNTPCNWIPFRRAGCFLLFLIISLRLRIAPCIV